MSSHFQELNAFNFLCKELSFSSKNQIILCGPRGSGKSLIIERLSNVSFLPHTHCISSASCLSVHFKFDENVYGAVFEQQPKVLLTDWDLVQRKIKNEAEDLTGVDGQLIVRIYSKFPFEMTVFELPDLEFKSEIEKEAIFTIMRDGHINSIILIVLPASINDSLMEEYLHLAKLRDANGLKTIVVVTRLDLVDGSIDMRKFLTKNVLQKYLKVIGVVSRPGKVIKSKQYFEDLMKREQKFFQSKYPSIADQHGMAKLKTIISDIFLNEIRNELPKLFDETQIAQTNIQKELEMMRIFCSEPNNIILKEVSKYAASYCCALSGNSEYVETKTLTGGAIISFIFQDVFERDLDATDPLNNLSRSKILTALRNATGTRPHVFFVPEPCFTILARRQLSQLLIPCKRIVDLVNEEMHKLIPECCKDMSQNCFQKLYEEIFVLTSDMLTSGYHACQKLVEDVLDMELAYIHTTDRQFTEEFESMKQLWLDNRNIYGFDEKPMGDQNDRRQDAQSNTNHSWLSTLLGRTSDNVPPMVDHQFQNMDALVREEADIVLTENFISSYFRAVCRRLKDTIPKVVMLKMVNHIQNNLYHYLMDRLQGSQAVAKESQEMQGNRSQLEKKLASLEKAKLSLSKLQTNAAI